MSHQVIQEVVQVSVILFGFLFRGGFCGHFFVFFLFCIIALCCLSRRLNFFRLLLKKVVKNLVLVFRLIAVVIELIIIGFPDCSRSLQELDWLQGLWLF